MQFFREGLNCPLGYSVLKMPPLIALKYYTTSWIIWVENILKEADGLISPTNLVSSPYSQERGLQNRDSKLPELIGKMPSLHLTFILQHSN